MLAQNADLLNDLHEQQNTRLTSKHGGSLPVGATELKIGMKTYYLCQPPWFEGCFHEHFIFVKTYYLCQPSWFEGCFHEHFIFAWNVIFLKVISLRLLKMNLISLLQFISGWFNSMALRKIYFLAKIKFYLNSLSVSVLFLLGPGLAKCSKSTAH